MSTLKKSLLAVLLTILSTGFLSSCTFDRSNSNNSHSNPTTKNYEDYEERHLDSLTFFDQEDDYYYVYIYSKTCSPCTSIKETIFTLADGMPNIYFYEYNVELRLSQEDMTTLIGASKFKDLFINGTPSLFKIENKVVKLATSGKSKVVDTLFEDYNS